MKKQQKESEKVCIVILMTMFLLLLLLYATIMFKDVLCIFMSNLLASFKCFCFCFAGLFTW